MPIHASGDTLFLRGYVSSKHGVLEKHTEEWAAFYQC